MSKSFVKNAMYIASQLSEEDALCQIAEEAAELAQAALKLRRAITGTNPTPKSRAEAIANLLEEVVDVDVSLAVWMAYPNKDIDYTGKKEQTSAKFERWASRIRAKNNTKEGGENAEEDKQQTEGRTV
ncbi:MAG: hypothetical protein IKB22_05135 [Lentisphaeria bacterium]|nr:hypothetical protein [Lentisphaeria bacterium]